MGLALNLAGADKGGFEAIPSDTYDCAIQEVTMTETKSEDGALPKGTPGLNVQFRVVGGDFDNRRLFNTYWIAPKKYEKKAMMDGMLARFFVALGFDEELVTGGSFEPETDELVGLECRVVVGQREYLNEMQNVVKNVKPVGSGSTSSLI